MALTAAYLISDFDNMTVDVGRAIVVRSRAPAVFTTGDYDVYSGTFLAGVSGVGFSGTGIIDRIDSAEGGTDFKFLEEGRITLSDSKLYLTGSIGINENSFVDVDNSGTTYFVLNAGVIPSNVAGSIVYNKVYIRKYTGG